LPVTDYMDARRLQKELVAARIDKTIDDDIVISLEHPPVFTIGRRRGRENLTVSEEFLKAQGIPVIDVERGGNITFHAPGQLVVYPIIRLENAGLKIDQYITRLEEVMIQTAAAYGVRATRNSLNRGAWVGNNKLGSIGICVRRGIAFHGLALNVNLELEPFGWINPCGLHGIGVTSIERELSRHLPMDEVRSTMKRTMENAFKVMLVEASLSDLQSRMNTHRTAKM
jgi:lipoate-protein ligase B